MIRRGISAGVATRTTLILLLWAVSSAAAGASGYRPYVNVPYEYAVAYPEEFTPKPGSEFADGLVFVSPTGDAELKLSAGACVAGMTSTPEEYIAYHERQEQTGSASLGRTRKGKRFAAVSGQRGDRAFLSKVIIEEKKCAEFVFEYDKEQKARYDPIAARIVSSFRRHPAGSPVGEAIGRLCQ